MAAVVGRRQINIYILQFTLNVYIVCIYVFADIKALY